MSRCTSMELQATQNSDGATEDREMINFEVVVT